MKFSNILITGCCGFIGYHTSIFFLRKGYKVFGIDNLNNYYDIKLKKKRLDFLKIKKNFYFKKKDINNCNLLNFVKKKKIQIIIHLAAQAGVRTSIDKPKIYFDSNISGFFNILEITKLLKIKLIYASSSSVYGNSKPMTETNTTKPIQFYATTKKCNELMAEVYSKIYKIPLIGLRFFTVYGNFGRPDMSYYKFSDLLRKKRAISVFNRFNHSRDFTHIDDVVNCIFLAFKKIKSRSFKGNQIFNVGSGKRIKLITLIKLLEKNFQSKFKIKILSKQVGDIGDTIANIDKAKKILNYKPNQNFEKKIKDFCDWYKKYYNFKIK